MSRAGLDIVYDESFDGGVWAATPPSSIGTAWLGPQGLVAHLELMLGIGERTPTPVERAIELTRTLGEGYWSASFAVQPYATARRLLEDRDLLVAWGWRGEPVSTRLDQLWNATGQQRAGIPDRILRIQEQLSGAILDIDTISIVDPLDSQPPIWQQLFLVLGRCGIRILVSPLSCSPARGDLAAARAAGFRPDGDGTLQLLRTHGVLAAADAVASVVAALDDDSSVLVINSDAVLDSALARYGVPRLGTDVPPPASAALLRAVIETAFHPCDSADVYALICADPGPVPRNIAWGLTNALREFAGRGAEPWRDGLATQLGLLEDDVRPAMAARLGHLLDPIAARDAVVTTAMIDARLQALTSWARGRQLVELAGRTDTFRRFLAHRTRVSRAELLMLCDELECEAIPGLPGEAGLHAVVEPGSVVAPARTVIWWGFTRDRAPRLPRLRLSPQERSALGKAVPDSGAIAAALARSWSRPLDAATERLVLVCPRTDAVGDTAHPHPLWDEVVARMADPVFQARLEVDDIVLEGAVRAVRHVAAARPLPCAFEVANAPSLDLRHEESPSSIETLLGCSLAHTLAYRGRLRPRLAAAPVEPGPLLYGNVAHHILRIVFANGARSPSAARMHAEVIFERELPLVAETLLLPDYQAERATLRRAIVDSAALVASIVERAGATLRGVEVPLSGRLGAAAVAGHADLVINSPDHVLDFKWGTSRARDKLRSGSAVQIALYAALVGSGADAAFLTLRDQRVLAARGSVIPFATEPGMHSLSEILAASLAALESRVEELSAGRLVAPGASTAVGTSRVVDGALRLMPDCDHCELGVLCGRRGRR